MVKEAEKLLMMMVVGKKKEVSGGDIVITADQERIGGSSSEEIDSAVPKIVKVGRNSRRCNTGKSVYNIGGGGGGVGIQLEHSQVLRIRDEDSHIGEDFNTQLLNLYLMLISRQILPASPLSRKKPPPPPPIKAAD